VVAANARWQEQSADDVETIGRPQKRRALERAAPLLRGRFLARLNVMQSVVMKVEREVVAEVGRHHINQPPIADHMLVRNLPEGIGTRQPAEGAKRAGHGLLAIGGFDGPGIARVTSVRTFSAQVFCRLNWLLLKGAT
jgi:hypothetical protein